MDMPNQDTDELTRSILTRASSEGNQGVINYYDSLMKDLPLIEQQRLVIKFQESILDIPNLRLSLIEQLGPAIEALGAERDFDYVLRGMSVGLGTQFAEGDYSEIPSNIKALEQVADMAACLQYKFQAHIFNTKLLMAQGKFAEAAGRLEDLTSKLDEASNFSGEEEISGEILANLVMVYNGTGQYELLEERLESLKSLDSPQYTTFQFYFEGVVAQSEANAEKAVESFDKAIDASESDLVKRWEFDALIGLAILKPEESTEHLDRATKLAHETQDADALLRIRLANLRRTFDSGNYKEARELAISLSEVKDPNAIALCAEVLVSTGPIELAKSKVSELLSIADKYQLTGLMAHANTLAASISDSTMEQVVHAEIAVRLYEEIGDTIGQGRALISVALADIERGNYSEALTTSNRILEIGNSYQKPDLISVGRLLVGLSAQGLGHVDASAYLESALEVAKSHHFVSIANRSLKALGRGDEATALIQDYGLENGFSDL